MKELITKLETLETILNNLREYVENKERILLSKEEKEELEEVLTYMTYGTTHNYTHIRYFRGDNERVELLYTSKTGEVRYDYISGLPRFIRLMVPTVIYKIEDLLR